MRKRKRLAMMLIIILTLQLVLPIMSVIYESEITLKSIAAEEVSSGDWIYTVNEDGKSITIIEYGGTEENLVIPSELDGYIVTVLDGNKIVDSGKRYTIFEFGYLISTIKLPYTLKTIGNFAFMGCENLTDIEINEGLEKIDNQAFIGCKKIETLYIPSTVTEIVNGYESYGRKYDINSFNGCKGLTSITVHSSNQYYSSIDGVLFNADKTELIAYPEAKKDISYSIPESVNKIYASAINNPNLENLYIPKNVEYMARWKSNFAIEGCINLKNIIVDELNETYNSENGILYNKSISSLLFYPSGKEDNYYIIPKEISISLTTINNPHIETIKINSLIYNIDFLLELTNLKNIEVDDENEDYMSKNGVLFNKDENQIVCYPQGRDEETYIIDEKVTEIKPKAFINSKIKYIILPQSLTVLGDNAFYNCENLNNITLSSNLSTISDYAFYNCNSLKSIKIPNSVVSIGEKAFYNCTSLKELTFDGKSKIEKIGGYAFYNCASLEEVNIPEGITNISNIFDKCNNLKILNIPKTVENFDQYSCTNIGELPKIITINNENPIMNKGWVFNNPEYGYTVIRCYSTATNVIDWAKSYGRFHYNLIDLNEDDIKFLYNINDNNEVVITDYIGDEENVEIPSEIEGLPVVSIGKCIGTYKKLVIPSTVQNIGVIYSCNLEYINVDAENQNFTSKDGILFNKNENELLSYPMGRKEVTYNIPEGTASIGGKDTYVTIGSSRYIPLAFFGNMHLESVYIPKSVNYIEQKALDMVSLSEISVDRENSIYISKDNILYKLNNKKAELEQVPTNIKGNVELLYGLEAIGTKDFSNNNNLESVIVPTTVNSITHNAFYCCKNLKKLVIAASTAELSGINSGNSIFTFTEGNEIKVYCEENSDVQEYAKKWNIDYEIIEVEKIEMKQKPKLNEDETLNLEDGMITLIYNDGTSLDLSMTSNLLNITEYDDSNTGDKYIEVDYKGHKANFNINETLEIDLGKYEEKQEEENIYLKNIAPETTIQEVLEDINTNATIEIYKGTEKIDNTETTICTGMKISFMLNNEQMDYTIIVTGDSNGDGESDFKDMLKINRHRLNKSNMIGEYLEAADINGDGQADFKDMIKINKFRLNKINEL